MNREVATPMSNEAPDLVTTDASNYSNLCRSFQIVKLMTTKPELTIKKFVSKLKQFQSSPSVDAQREHVGKISTYPFTRAGAIDVSSVKLFRKPSKKGASRLTLIPQKICASFGKTTFPTRSVSPENPPPVAIEFSQYRVLAEPFSGQFL